jgi:hypothetical protein
MEDDCWRIQCKPARSLTCTRLVQGNEQWAAIAFALEYSPYITMTQRWRILSKWHYKWHWQGILWTHGWDSLSQIIPRLSGFWIWLSIEWRNALFFVCQRQHWLPRYLLPYVQWKDKPGLAVLASIQCRSRMPEKNPQTSTYSHHATLVVNDLPPSINFPKESRIDEKLNLQPRNESKCLASCDRAWQINVYPKFLRLQV